MLSHPLAGSARRQIDPQLDRAAAAGLEQSGKDHREHAMVVEAILDTLTPWCRDLRCPEGTRVTLDPQHVASGHKDRGGG